jgi:hypothetical protein
MAKAIKSIDSTAVRILDTNKCSEDFIGNEILVGYLNLRKKLLFNKSLTCFIAE